MIIARNGISHISSLLAFNSDRIVENAIATLIQLDTEATHAEIYSPSNRKQIERHQSSQNPVLRNLAILFCDSARDVGQSNYSQATTSRAVST